MSDFAERLRAAGVHALPVRFTDVHRVANGKFVPLRQLGEVLTTTDDLLQPTSAQIGVPGPDRLPASLDDALTAPEGDEVVGAAPGPGLAPDFARRRRAEAAEYARRVSGRELDRHAARF